MTLSSQERRDVLSLLGGSGILSSPLGPGWHHRLGRGGLPCSCSPCSSLAHSRGNPDEWQWMFQLSPACSPLTPPQRQMWGGWGWKSRLPAWPLLTGKGMRLWFCLWCFLRVRQLLSFCLAWSPFPGFFFFLLERAGYSCGIFVPSCWHFWVAGSSNSQSGINEAKKKTLGTLHHVLLWVLNPAFFFIHFRVFFYLFYVHCPGF